MSPDLDLVNEDPRNNDRQRQQHPPKKLTLSGVGHLQIRFRVNHSEVKKEYGEQCGKIKVGENVFDDVFHVGAFFTPGKKPVSKKVWFSAKGA